MHSFNKAFKFLILLIFFEWHGIVSSAEDSESEEARIVGGLPAIIGQFPWTVALHRNNEYICSASLISEKTVLTAAHCIVRSDGSITEASDLYGIGGTVLSNARRTRIDFSSVNVNEDYVPETLENDIAILQTDKPVVFNWCLRPVCLAGPNTGLNAYRNAVAMGWGYTRVGEAITRRPSPYLEYTNQNILSQDTCRNYSEVTLYEDGDPLNKKLCAVGLRGSPPLNNGLCYGDSGGPLVNLGNWLIGSPVQIGINSYFVYEPVLSRNETFKCALLDRPSVYARVSSFYDWLINAADDDNICFQ